MTTFVPRKPYSEEELKTLYPKELQLQLVQVLLRHGERSPVSVRFQNAGLHPYWPYCTAATRMTGSIMTTPDASSWDDPTWRRRLETFGLDDAPALSSGPNGETDGVCQLGELTDKGRETTLALGQRLRHLYVDQLGFMPKSIADADMIYLRATPMTRALESLQQSLNGMYPPSTRATNFPPPTIVTRTPADETLYPNGSNCRRFNQLSKAFAQRAADRWNKSSEMAYLNKLYSKWMPENSKEVAVDGHPRLSGIMDTINSTLAHGPNTRLPSEFYDEKGREILERIGVEEWFQGYNESQEYRTVGIGALVGDIVSRMVGHVRSRGGDGLLEIGGKTGEPSTGRGGEKAIKFAMSGCHDTTLAAVLTSLGAYDTQRWPPYTSHLAVELFKKADTLGQTLSTHAPKQSFRSSRFGKPIESLKGPAPIDSEEIAVRKQAKDMSLDEKARLNGYFVRLRYNDRPMTVPGCKLPGNHLEGDESFCTLEAFKKITDKYTPNRWKVSCMSNLDAPTIPSEPERAGF